MALDPALYESNLAALRGRQPGAARIIATANPPPYQFAIGRDGTPTLRFDHPINGSRWLGASSMPAISAAALAEGFAASGENVALPGMLTGLEALAVLDRLPRHAALFVIEDDPAQIQLALRVRSYKAQLVSGRLIFLTGGPLETRLAEFFADHPGYLLPATLLTPPQRSPARIAALQRELEAAARPVAAAQWQQVESIAAQLKQEPQNARSNSPRIAVLSTDAGESTHLHTEQLQDVLRSLQWEHDFCIPDKPEKCHPWARLAAVQRCSADLVLMLNCPASPLADLLPLEVPVVSWLLPGFPWSALEPPREKIHAAFCCRSDGHRLALAGWPEDRTILLPPAIPTPMKLLRENLHELTPNPRVPNRTDQQFASRRSASNPVVPENSNRVGLFMDVPDVRPESLKLNLHSHCAFWHALLEIAGTVNQFPDADTALAWFERAEKKAETSMTDPEVREYFLSLMRERAIPQTIARITAQTLVEAGLSVAAFGKHWSMIRGVDPQGPIPLSFVRTASGLQSTLPDDHQTIAQDQQVSGPTPAKDAGRKQPIAAGEKTSSPGRDPSDVWQVDSRIRSIIACVLPQMDSLSAQHALEALSLNRPVLMYASPEAFRREFPGLEGAAEFITFYESRESLSKAASKLPSRSRANRFQISNLKSSLAGVNPPTYDDAERDQREAARRYVEEHHTMTARLLTLVNHVRRGAPTCGTS